MALEYTTRKGLTLDTKLNMRDLGKSGYTGKNLTDGALGTFVKALETGEVKKGSYLLIEDIDRLSRLPVMQALAVFQSIINGGVTVVNLKDKKEYSRESLNDNWFELMPILVSMGRAHEESTRKATLLGKAWKKKKEAAVNEQKPMGNNAPMWLEYIEEDKAKGIKAHYKPIPKWVVIVERIFQLSIAGNGRSTIAALLNKEGISAFKGGKWGTTQISRILSSRAVLGEYQPKTMREKDGDPVIGYFEPILDEDTFNRAAAANKSRHIHRATKTTKNFNVWAGVAKCSICSSSMYSISKGKPPKGYTYLSCSGTRLNGCKAKAIRIEKTEHVYREILAKVGDKSLAEDKSAALAIRLDVLQGKLALEDDKLSRLAEGMLETPSRALMTAVHAQERITDGIKEEIVTLKLSLASDPILDKKAFFAALDMTSREVRQKSNELLKRLNIIVKIDGEANHYAVVQDNIKILDIVDSKDCGISFYPATPSTSSAVWEQEGDFMPSFNRDLTYVEDNYASEGDYGDSNTPA